MLASINSMPCDPIPAFSWPKAGHRNFSTTFPSQKNRRSLRCGTRLQADFCVRLEHDAHVQRYWAQPHVFKWTEGTKKFRYAPHFLVENDDGGGCYCTVQANFTSMTAPQGETLLAFDALCREQGWQFSRIADETVHTPSFATLQKLYLRSLDSTPEEYAVCIQILPALVWPATVREVLNALPPSSLAALCSCLFSGRLLADLSQALNPDLIIQGLHTGEGSV
ncbi:hypothetical protein ACYZT7_16340 [Pseudomonas sp. RT4P38]